MVLTESGAWVTAEGAPVRPRAESRAAGLLRYPDGPSASAERRLRAGGRLIWCGLPPLSTPLLRTWAEEAGVHLYAPAGHTVWASAGLISVTSGQGGVATVRWPRDVTARDLFNRVSASGRESEWRFAPGQTRLLAVTRRGKGG
jgi:hypothetical protein